MNKEFVPYEQALALKELGFDEQCFNMEKEFVPYEQALALKELGFDEQCFSFYDSDGELYKSEGYYKKGYNVFDEEVIAPLFQQAFRWFREKHGLVGIVKFGTNDFTYNIYNTDGIGLLTKESLNFNGTYEEAELVCLQKLIEIVKNK
jgi:hypothetical protein